MLRHALIAMSDSDDLRRAVMASPVTAGVVERFVAGESVVDALVAVRALTNDGLTATVDHLGEHTTDPGRAEAATEAYLSLLDLIAGAGLSNSVEVSVKLSALGQALPDGSAISTEHARRICAQAAGMGTTVTVDMEDHTTTEATLRTLERPVAGLPRHRRGPAVGLVPDRTRLPQSVRPWGSGPAVQGGV